jgi:Cu/Ag efflux protein CusF
MRNLVFLGLSSIVAAGLSGLAAQDPPPAAKASPYTSTIGEVSNIDTAKKELTVKTDAGASVTVPLDDKTHFLKISPGEKDLKKATESKFAELKSGDRVQARNRKLDGGDLAPATTVLVMTREELVKHQEKTQQEWTEKGLMGTVTVVNPATKEVSIKLMGSDPKQVVIEPSDKVNVRRYSSESVKFSDAKASTLAEIKSGDTLRVLGIKNEDGTRVQPEEIVFGTFVRQAGTITAIDAAAGTITIKDLQTKKPVLVKINSGTVLKKLPEQMAQMLARNMQGGGRAGAPGGAPGGAPSGGAPGGGRQGGGPPADGANGPGGAGRGMGRMDPSKALERAPLITLADLKTGDAVMISSSSGADPSTVTAITLVAGMEPILTAPAAKGGQDPLSGSWGFDMPIPQ